MPMISLPTGAVLHYEKAGKGEPVILLHGFMGTGRTELGGLIDALSKTHLVFAPTYRGYGKSLPKPRTFPHDFYQRDAGDILAFMDALKLKKVHLLGFSDGGEIGLILAGTHPERFRSVVVWGAIGYVGPGVKKEVAKYYPPTWVTEEIKNRHGIKDPGPMVKQWVETIEWLADQGGDLSVHTADRIKEPLLMMLGDKDYLNPPQYAAKILVRAYNSRLRMFPCGHRIHDDLPERFLQVVREFINRYPMEKRPIESSYSGRQNQNKPLLPLPPSALLLAGGLSWFHRRKKDVAAATEKIKG
ncbi:MAG: alpha/beta hydrolase [Acidobacteria bacterium]|nr:alpha/beta hydrolase [Acidobacteriota bacterium]